MLDGTLSVSRTQYNDQGRPWRVYEPGSGNPSSLYNQSNYDILGRISGASLANGGSTSITYQGLTTLNVDARGKQSKTTANYLGQTLSTEDHLGSKLTFSYDVYGNLKTAIASSGSLSSTRSTNDYNT